MQPGILRTKLVLEGLGGIFMLAKVALKPLDKVIVDSGVVPTI